MRTLRLISVVSASAALSACATQPASPPPPVVTPYPAYNAEPPPVSDQNSIYIPPRVIQTVNPVYPAEARAKEIVGVVTVVFDVAPSGKVVFATITSSPDPILSQAVVNAISQWQFIPGTQNGEKIHVRMHMSFAFNRSGNP
ncbi:MAG: TonB family protein [Opitutaceae bacterium]|jgi:protein TonB